MLAGKKGIIFPCVMMTRGLILRMTSKIYFNKKGGEKI